MSHDRPFLDALAKRMAGETPQARALGLAVVAVDAGQATMKVAWREDLVGDPRTGVLAGGVVTTLLDHACGLAVGSRGQRSVATLDLRIDYMRAARKGEAVFATARCYAMTRSIGFVRATAFETDIDDPVATAQAAFAITNASIGEEAA